jgi:hypothetical protein
MAKLTKTQTKRAFNSIKSKVNQLYLEGHLSQGAFITMTGQCDKALNKLK